MGNAFQWPCAEAREKNNHEKYYTTMQQRVSASHYEQSLFNDGGNLETLEWIPENTFFVTVRITQLNKLFKGKINCSGLIEKGVLTLKLIPSLVFPHPMIDDETIVLFQDVDTVTTFSPRRKRIQLSVADCYSIISFRFQGENISSCILQLQNELKNMRAQHSCSLIGCVFDHISSKEYYLIFYKNHYSFRDFDEVKSQFIVQAYDGPLEDKALEKEFNTQNEQNAYIFRYFLSIPLSDGRDQFLILYEAKPGFNSRRYVVSEFPGHELASQRMSDILAYRIEQQTQVNGLALAGIISSPNSGTLFTVLSIN